MPHTLRPYQETGRGFLRTRRFAILGDFMGLGKTPQYLRAAQDVGGRILILAPAATLPGLAREIMTWAPGLGTPTVLDHAGKRSAPDVGVSILAWTSAAKRMPDLIVGPMFDVVICDESHRLKNPTAKSTRAVLGQWVKVAGQWVRTHCLAAHSRRLWAATGTPLPNRPIDLQPLLHMGGGIRWASRAAFGDAYCRQFNRFTPTGFDYLGANNLDHLNSALTREGCLLRRLPEDVPGELPAFSVSIVPLAGVRDPVSMLGMSAALIREACDAGESVPFEETSAYRAEVGLAKAPKASAWIKEWLEDHPGDALVVFAWHKAVGELIAGELGDDALLAHGGHSPKKRQSQVDAFAAGAGRVFIGSIAACGTGLNGLHLRTTMCVFAESPWTHYEMVQAIGRVRRFGSVNDHTHAYILVGEDSIEDYVLQTVAKKLDISDAVLGEGEHAFPFG